MGDSNRPIGKDKSASQIADALEIETLLMSRADGPKR